MKISKKNNYEKKIKPYYSQKFVDNTFKIVDFIKLEKIFFNNIHIFNQNNLEAIKNEQKLYVSNHLSLADYLIQSYLFYKNNIKMPHFIAGENLFVFPFNIIYKKFGAISVNRNEKSIQYWKIYDDIIKEYFRNGDDFLVYPEGGRNYSGIGINEFKTGTFKQVLEIIKEGKKIYAVPIKIRYDKIIEADFLKKTIKHKQKRDKLISENKNFRASIHHWLYYLNDNFAFINRIFDEEKGNAYMKIGVPFLINDYFQKYQEKAKYYLAQELKKNLEEIVI